MSITNNKPSIIVLYRKVESISDTLIALKKYQMINLDDITLEESEILNKMIAIVEEKNRNNRNNRP